MEKELQNAVLPEKVEVKVLDKTYTLKKLSNKQILELVKFWAKYFVANKEKFKNIAGKFTADGSVAEDLLVVLEMFSIEQVNELLSILLGESDINFINENIDFALTLEILLKVVELNKNSDLKKNLEILFNLLLKTKNQMVTEVKN